VIPDFEILYAISEKDLFRALDGIEKNSSPNSIGVKVRKV
jgi:hypothetical protein